MAMLDYGAIVIKDGQIINQNDMFQDMISCVGWKDESINGRFFAYVGNEKITLCFHKYFFYIYEDKIFTEGIYLDFSSIFNKKSYYVNTRNISIKVKILCERVYCASFNIDGHHYKVVFGYGIDPCKQIWNKSKYSYLGKNIAKKVDKIINGCW